MSNQNTDTQTGGYGPYHPLTAEDKQVFDEATYGMVGVIYTPQTVSTQVVAGTNYRFKCKATRPPAFVIWNAIVEIFKPLNGRPYVTRIISPEEREILLSSVKNAAASQNSNVQTAATQMLVGADCPCPPTPRPDLSGLRLTTLTPNGAVYLVNPEGYLMLIPDATTYNNLFIDWNGIIPYDITTIAMGSPFTEGAILAMSAAGTVLVVSNAGDPGISNVKRGIPSPAVMTKYYFNWGAVVHPPEVLLDFIADGTIWS